MQQSAPPPGKGCQPPSKGGNSAVNAYWCSADDLATFLESNSIMPWMIAALQIDTAEGELGVGLLPDMLVPTQSIQIGFGDDTRIAVVGMVALSDDRLLVEVAGNVWALAPDHIRLLRILSSYLRASGQSDVCTARPTNETSQLYIAANGGVTRLNPPGQVGIANIRIAANGVLFGIVCEGEYAVLCFHHSTLESDGAGTDPEAWIPLTFPDEGRFVALSRIDKTGSALTAVVTQDDGKMRRVHFAVKDEGKYYTVEWGAAQEVDRGIAIARLHGERADLVIVCTPGSKGRSARIDCRSFPVASTSD